MAIASAAAIPAAAREAAGLVCAGAARTAGIGFGAGFVDFQIAPAELLAVQFRDSLCRFVIVGHLDESEAARAASFAVHGDVNAGDLADGSKKVAQLALGGLKIHVPYKQTLHTPSPMNYVVSVMRR